jgi:hypothetical protein
MKYMKYISLLATLAFALSLTAFAKDNQSGKFTLDNPAQVGSTRLPAGNYTAEWSGPANAVKIDIMHHGKTVATTEGQIKDLQRPSPYNAVMVDPVANNPSQKAIREIDFNHRTEALQLSGE